MKGGKGRMPRRNRPRTHVQILEGSVYVSREGLKSVLMIVEKWPRGGGKRWKTGGPNYARGGRAAKHNKPGTDDHQYEDTG